MRICGILFIILFLFSCKRASAPLTNRSVSDVMDSVITRLYKQVQANQYDSIDDAFMLKFLSEEEKQVLATRFQYFTVNVPVTIFLMRHKDQQVVPFWIEPAGFRKTDAIIKNAEGYVYEVWEKKADAGKISLGINGFDKHRPVYFISVAPQHAGDDLRITDVFPSQYVVTTLEKGAFTYHDWSGLLLTEVPEKMAGQKLFTTVRGRAREAHVVGAFRKTLFPSYITPDQIMLTWSGSPKTSIDIQWRTTETVDESVVKYWVSGTADTLTMKASVQTVQDRMLFNDRFINRFTANLKDLRPGALYEYRVGANKDWSVVDTFRTEPASNDPFSFVWFGDTHCFPDSGKLIALTSKHKDVSFYSIAGDIVSTGLYRDDWDKFFEYQQNTFAHKPLMPVLGNHDRQDGLGAQLYYDQFSLPKNGPPKVEPEASYSFEYGNALFIMIDATSEVVDHTTWIEETLKNTKATWKFVMFHFPPYNFEEPYLDIQQAWVPLFDKYHVDMVMGGHIHYYMRSNPMNNGKVVDSFAKGTVYAISIGIPSKHDSMTTEPYAVKQYDNGYFYQLMEINGNVLKYKTYDSNDVLKDEFEIRK